MVDITEQLNHISQSVYGKDVREAIVSALAEIAALVNFDEERLNQKEIAYIDTQKYTPNFNRLWGDADGNGAVDNSDIIAVSQYLQNKGSIFADAVNFDNSARVMQKHLDKLSQLLSAKRDDQIIVRHVVHYVDGEIKYIMAIAEE